MDFKGIFEGQSDEPVSRRALKIVLLSKIAELRPEF